MHEMQGLVPDLLTNWFSLTRAKDALFVSLCSVSVEWSFTYNFRVITRKSAGALLSNSTAETNVNMETVSHLFETIAVWAEKMM